MPPIGPWVVIVEPRSGTVPGQQHMRQPPPDTKHYPSISTLPERQRSAILCIQPSSACAACRDALDRRYWQSRCHNVAFPIFRVESNWAHFQKKNYVRNFHTPQGNKRAERNSYQDELRLSSTLHCSPYSWFRFERCRPLYREFHFDISMRRGSPRPPFLPLQSNHLPRTPKSQLPKRRVLWVCLKGLPAEPLGPPLSPLKWTRVREKEF